MDRILRAGTRGEFAPARARISMKPGGIRENTRKILKETGCHFLIGRPALRDAGAPVRWEASGISRITDKKMPASEDHSLEAGFACLKSCHGAMVLHALAQEVHSSAHFVQCSSLNIAHSEAHFSQMVAQSLQRSFENWASEDMKQAASLQMPAHSFNMPIHFTRVCTSGSFRQSMKHSLHA